MFSLSKRHLIFLTVTFLLLTIVVKPIYATESSQASSFSWWDSITSFFGFGSTNTNGNNDYVSDSSAQTDTGGNDQVFGGEDLINSDKVKGNKRVGSNAVEQVADQTISFAGTANIACLPSLARADEPVLIRYSCPAAQKLTESSFGATDSEGVSLLSNPKEVEYIKCEDRTGESESRFECKITRFAPLVTTFSLDPANPQEGEPLRVIAKTQDMKNCKISNTHRSFVKYGTDFDFTYSAKNHDTIKLTCTDKTGLLIRKIIKY